MRIAFHVFSLLGQGHLQRAAALAQAWQGHDVVWLGHHPAGAPGRAIASPLVWDTLDGPTDAERQRLEHAARQLAATLSERPFDVLITEYFPFGGQRFFPAFVPLLTAAKAARIPVLASVRDVLGKSDTDAGWAKGVQQALAEWYAGVLWHGDARFLRFDFPQASRLAVPLIPTGYVAAEPAPRRPADRHLLASCGSTRRGGLAFAMTALSTFRHLATDGWHMTLVAGPDHLAPLQRQAAAMGLEDVTIVPWIADMAGALAEATVSLSQCGYNTFAEVVRSGAPAVFLPHVEPGDDEQWRRAEAIARFPGYATLPVSAADLPQQLAEMIGKMAGTIPQPPEIAWQGPANSLQALLEVVRR